MPPLLPLSLFGVGGGRAPPVLGAGTAPLLAGGAGVAPLLVGEAGDSAGGVVVGTAGSG